MRMKVISRRRLMKRNPTSVESHPRTETGHTHSVTTCRHDSEGPTTLWLCGHDPISTPVSTPSQSSPEETYEYNFLRCPYCRHENYDAWELGTPGEDDSGKVDCGSCGREYEWIRSTSVSYQGKPVPRVKQTATD